MTGRSPSEETVRPTALIVQHEQPTPPGLVQGWLDDQRWTAEAFRIDLEDRDLDVRRYQLVVSLGSEFPAYDDSVPFMGRERALLEAAITNDVPVLGICFGGQLLARVLGGTVFRADQAEIGWLRVRSHDPQHVPEGPWFQWHFDSFTLPPGARLLAESEVGPQVFTAGPHMGLQFHPEVTPEIMEDWVRVYAHELHAEGVDPRGLLAETRTRAEQSRSNAWTLFGELLASVAGRPGAGEAAAHE